MKKVNWNTVGKSLLYTILVIFVGTALPYVLSHVGIWAKGAIVIGGIWYMMYQILK